MVNYSSKLSKYVKNNNGYTVNSSKIRDLFDIERIAQNPLYTCTIAGGRSNIGGFTLQNAIQGIYNPDAPFTISVGSEYQDTFTLPAGVDKINEVTGWGANMSGKTQFILKSLRMTEQRWTGSTAPEFSVKIDIPIVRKNNDAWKTLVYALQATLGTLNDYNGQGQVQSNESAWQIFAPNGYKVNYNSSSKGGDTPEGTYTIELGSGTKCWFRMRNALITNMDYSISNKKYYDGNPVSVSFTVHFKFWRQPLFEEVTDWFPLANRISF